MEFNSDTLIKSNKLLEILECDICSELMNNSSIINCGHSFCENCIKSWLNTNNTCPNCKFIACQSDIKKNYLIESLKSEILNQKSYSETNNIKSNYLKYIDNNNNNNNNFDIDNNAIADTFFNHLKSIFTKYNDFNMQLYNNEKLQIKSILESNLNLDSQGNYLYNYESINEIPENNELNVQINNIIKKTYTIRSNLISTLDKYLKENLPASPIDLPIKTKIIIPGYNDQVINNIVLHKTDSVKKLYLIVRNYFECLGDPIQNLDNLQFVIKKYNLSTDINGNIEHVENNYVLENIDDLFLTLPIHSGEIIVLKGDVETISTTKIVNKINKCIKLNFKKDESVDYFSCNECNLKWICEVCNDICHSNHTKILFKLDHKPSWACCYCSKSKNCKFVN